MVFISIIVVFNDNSFAMFVGFLGWVICLFSCFVMNRISKYKGGRDGPILHSRKIFTHHLTTNVLVVLYTSTLIPVIFMAFGPKNAAIFSVFFIYWSLLNIIINLVFNNNYLVEFKREGPSPELYNKTILTGLLLGLAVFVVSVFSLPLFITYLWAEYSSSVPIFLSLFSVLFFRTLSASFGVFLSLGSMVKYKVFAQLIFIASLYGSLAFGVEWLGFLYIYILSEALLAFFYFMAATIFSKRGMS
jgi:hypothetical protein